MRSVDLLSFYLADAIIRDRSRGRSSLCDPADARDVPAGPPVAPPRHGSSWTRWPDDHSSRQPAALVQGNARLRSDGTLIDASAGAPVADPVIGNGELATAPPTITTKLPAFKWDR